MRAGGETQRRAEKENPVGLGPQPPVLRAPSAICFWCLPSPLQPPERTWPCCSAGAIIPACRPCYSSPGHINGRQGCPSPCQLPGCWQQPLHALPGLSPPTPGCPPCLLHPPAWLEPQSILSRSKPKPPQQRSSYLLSEKGGNTFFNNYCFFHLTGCKLVNFFL